LSFSITLSDLSSIEDVKQLWRGLDSDIPGSFFTAWPWIGTWLSLLPSFVTPQLLRLERDGQCCGAAIAVRRKSRRHGIVTSSHLHINETGDPQFDCLTIEHNGFAGRKPGDNAAWQALLDWFGTGTAEVDELSIPGMTHEITNADLGPQLCRAEETVAYRVDLASIRNAGGAIGRVLSPNARQQLNSSIRALAASGPLRLEAAKDADEALLFFDGLKRLHIRSWTRRRQKHGFTYPFTERFHRKLIEHCMPRGEVELLRLSAGTREFGYLYNFCYNGVAYAYQSGLDDEDRHLRPGYVAHALAIERATALGASTYDFMAGSNRVKERFATDRYPMRWYTIQKPLLRFKAEQAARDVKRWLLNSPGGR
jgi:Acetyltransferase (GNAT) domain